MQERKKRLLEDEERVLKKQLMAINEKAVDKEMLVEAKRVKAEMKMSVGTPSRRARFSGFFGGCE